MLTTDLNHADYALYTALWAMQIDGPEVEFTFVKRLAAENAWSVDYAERVMEEYRRFLLLTSMVNALLVLSPSDAVDQAWHLHLLYSRSYWNDLCQNILQRPLHHDPIEGGGKDRETFIAQYTQTLEAYQAYLGEKPPADIWPAPEVRFGAAQPQFVRVDL